MQVVTRGSQGVTIHCLYHVDHGDLGNANDCSTVWGKEGNEKCALDVKEDLKCSKAHHNI